MSTLYLLNYNNYYNRIVKSTTLASYKSQALYTLKDVNFKPMDSCYTDQVVNISESVNPDYVVVTETANNVETISSRWFILESSRVRGNQYKLRLRRDVFVDYNSIVAGATLFCEKGYVNPDDPLIFNSEGNTYNQIKTSEKLLKDGSGVAWLVGYCDNKLFADVAGDSLDVVVNASTPAYTQTFETLSDVWDADAWPNSFPYSTGGWQNVRTDYVAYTFSLKQTGGTKKSILLSADSAVASDTLYNANNTVKSIPAILTYAGMTFPSAAELNEDAEYDVMYTQDPPVPLYYDYVRKLESSDGTIIRVGTGLPYTFYQLKITHRSSAPLSTRNLTAALCPRGYENLNTFLSECYDRNLWDGAYTYPDDAKMTYHFEQIKAEWVNITENVTAKIKKTIPLCKTAPYYMFCMPYQNIEYAINALDPDETETANSTLTMPFVQQLIKDVGTHVLDAQILPYFPDQYFIHNGVISLFEVDPASVTYIEDSNNDKHGFIYWGAPQTFNVFITESIAELPNRKVDNETRFCRLNAPNYSASFDFSIAKNNGVSEFRATCTYRPYQPHIQVMPDWGGIYGQYFPDGRGLICGGDYSIDIVNDQWTEYQIMNKNYQLMFDRQIQSMDLQHDVQKINDIFGAASGTLSGAASGAMMGFLGPGGMGVALLGGAVSAIGGALDIKNQQKLRTDQREAAFDMFNYNLGNIQARPTTITKMSALVGNNKIWPFYEIYNATTREQQLLEAQLEYSSMTVQAVGIVSEFVSGGPTFIRGRLIRITGLEHDAEMSQLVADELARGIYMDIQLS